MTSRVQVAVVGAGIAGLTVAAALSRTGFRCEVLEQTRLIGDVGAGVQIAPNAARVLHRLGLEPYLQTVAVRPQAIEMRRWDDNTVLQRTPLGAECEERFGAPYYTVHRADLHRGLANLLQEGTLHLGYRVTGIEEHSRGVTLHCGDGSRVTADLVVGADGIHSVIRDRLISDSPRFSGQSIYRGLVPAPEVPDLLEEPKVTLWLGPGQHCVAYPIRSGKLLSLAATTPGHEWHAESWSAEGRIEDLTASYAGWNDQVRRLTTAPDAVSRWALHDRDTIDRWGTGRLTLVGDAAHPMLPFMAQGANQAIEDTIALSRCLGDAARGGHEEALRRYEEVRRHRTHQVHQISRENTSLLHVDDGEQQQHRDAAMATEGDLRSKEWIYGYDAELAAAEWGNTANRSGT